MPRVFYVDPENGNDASAGITFATRRRTINSAVATLTAGDELRIIANLDPVNIGLCTWNSYGTITLPVGETVALYNDGQWRGPGSAFISSLGTSTTQNREGANAAFFTIQPTYTGTTKIASFSGFGPVDLSTYSKINLWFAVGTTTATYANLSSFSLLLCSDNDGNVPVISLRFPPSNPLSAPVWVPLTLTLNDANFSGATSINSITLSSSRQYHTAAASVFVDNVFASKNVRLDGLISKNSTTNVDTSKPELWWAIRSVTSNVATLDQSPGVADYRDSPAEGYFGATETVNAYALKPLIQTGTVTTGDTATLNAVAGRTGTTAEPIIIGGGWDRVAMAQQSGVSWLAASNNTQTFIEQSTSRDIVYNNLGFSRCGYGLELLGTSVTTTSGIYLNNVHFAAVRRVGFITSTGNSYALVLSGCSATQCGAATTLVDGGFLISSFFNVSAINCASVNCYGAGIDYQIFCNNSYGRNIICANNYTGGGTRPGGFNLNATNCKIENLSCINNFSYGLSIGRTNKSTNNTFVNTYVNGNGNTTVTDAGGLVMHFACNNTFYNTLVTFNSGAAGANSPNGGVILTSQAAETVFYNLSTQNNRVGSTPTSIKTAMAASSNTIGNIYIKNWNYNESTNVVGWNINDSTVVYSTNQSNSGGHFAYTNNGTIEGTTVSARSPGICWQMNLQRFNNASTTFIRDETYPLVHDIKSILCTANIPMTASLWVRRTDGTVAGKFVARGFQINGIDNDVSVYTTAASLTNWERLSIALNPTETGFIKFEMQAFSSITGSRTSPTGILIWDDFNATPATTVAATSGDFAFIMQGVVVSTPVSASGSSVATPTETSYMFC